MTAPRFLPAGDAALVVEFGDRLDPLLNAQVLALDAALRDAPPAGVREMVPTLRSLLVHYDPDRTDAAALAAEVRERLPGTEARPVASGRRWRLPVCYGGTHGPDLDWVAERVGRSADEVVQLHAGARYRAAMVGFLPGCAYLLGLPDALALPRRSTPRTRVPRGAVGIALSMSLVYPADSPGGWHLLGHCPVPLFDLRRSPAALIEAGDEIRFEPVDAAEIAAIDRALTAGDFDVTRECGR